MRVLELLAVAVVLFGAAYTWLADNAERYRHGPAAGQSVSDFIAGARAWQRAKAEAGYAAIRWPREQGGLDGTPMQEVIFSDEEARFQVPVGPFTGPCLASDPQDTAAQDWAVVA